MFDVSIAPAAARAVSTYSDQAVQLGLRLLGALLVLLLGMWVARRLAGFAQAALGRANLDSTLSGFLRNLIYGVLVVLLVVTALGVLGVPSAPLVAALGTAGLAIGLALQGSLSNLAWGVLLVLFRPFRVGDYVSAGGTEGTVQSINLMHTQLVMPDNREAILPNAKVGGDAIINFNRRGTRRFELTIPIGMDDDIGKAMTGIGTLLAADPRILKQPPPSVVTGHLGDGTVSLIVRGWARCDDLWGAQTDLLRSIKETFAQAGIRIAAPQRQMTLVPVRGAQP
ncbi:MAG: mechanosensitive ion channel domain-containing protein [Rhodanobacter sp.]|uniref:mechanosensitive ion channel family protein n=1 Tax=Rhodanobacter sp. KK11 TaxID=3083255 RepID=UPI0029663963|nr:mechanosensitive ion channel domain-containing protein [Rhodanobacter sp. KK11]MDW2980207.1 mechanosensitive ion channel [Rhodanobacter sp. KK11]